MEDIFKKGKFELLTLIVKKTKDDRKISCFGISPICARVQENEKARKREAASLNDVWYRAGVAFRYAGSKILCVRFEFASFKVTLPKGRSSGMIWIE